MVRRLLTRLRRDEDGYTLPEVLIVAGGLAFILSAILGLGDVATKSSPADRERVHVVRETQIALDKMTRELRAAHAITIESFKATAQVLRNGTSVTVTYDCSAAPVNGLRRCDRTQSGSPAPALTVLPRVANSSSRPVFTASDRDDGSGTGWTTFVRVRVEVPLRGELAVGAKARAVLDDGFYLRNIDALH